MRSPVHFVLIVPCVFLFLRFLCRTGTTGENPSRTEIDVHKLDAAVAEQDFADLVGVRHAPGLQDIQPAVALPVDFDITQKDPGIDKG